jgi:hypothetical protein
MEKIKCISCGKELIRVFHGNTRTIPPEQDAWCEAVVHIVVGGYGSRHDMSELVVGICDDCVDRKVKEGKILVKNDTGS